MERGRDKNGGNASGPFPVLYCLLLMNPLFIHFGACSSGVWQQSPFFVQWIRFDWSQMIQTIPKCEIIKGIKSPIALDAKLRLLCLFSFALHTYNPLLSI